MGSQPRSSSSSIPPARCPSISRTAHRRCRGVEAIGEYLEETKSARTSAHTRRCLRARRGAPHRRAGSTRSSMPRSRNLCITEKVIRRLPAARERAAADPTWAGCGRPRSGCANISTISAISPTTAPGWPARPCRWPISPRRPMSRWSTISAMFRGRIIRSPSRGISASSRGHPSGRCWPTRCAAWRHRPHYADLDF